MSERLFIFDGMAFAFRAYYAIRTLSDSKGRPTNAVFGFARVLLKILREQTPSHAVMVFDAPGPTFRDDLYPEYKANRDETPQDLIDQFPLIDKVVEAFDIPILRVPGVEADDVMGTVARVARENSLEAVLVTGDKDLLQLVQEGVQVFDPNRGDMGTWYDAAAVKERYGVTPERVIDLLGLMGDSADNVPGVRGIGEKTARKLLEKYESMEGLYEHVGELKGKQKEKVEADRDIAFLSRQLVTIVTDVDFDCRLEDFRSRPWDRSKLSVLFADLEFQSLLEEFLPEASDQEETDYRLILTRADLEAVIGAIEEKGSCAVDTETTSTDPMRAKLVGVSLSYEDCAGFYIPVAHTPFALLMGGEAVRPLPKEEALDLLRPMLENPTIGKVGHNLKYDLVVFKRAGIDLQGITMDTMIASYLTDPSRMRHNLSEVSLQYLKRKMIPISDLIGKGSKAISFDNVPVDAACEYASEDADVAWRLAGYFQSSLQDRDLGSLFEEVELPLIGVLARMEMAGVAIDAQIFEELAEEIAQRLIGLEAEIVELAGEPFQINSPKQLQKVLFEKLGLPPKRRTKTGYSTDVDVLEELALEHPLPGLVLEYRTMEKLRGTYVSALPKLVNPETGKIHTSYNQAVAATGRLSSSDPNLQNIPIRTPMGRRIREGFVPDGPDKCFISADYSQIELRILAHLAGDEALRDAFAQGRDIHADTASRVFGVALDEVTDDMRRHAKAVNFGVVYGMSAFGLARSIGVSNAEAARFIENYFAEYPGVKQWIERTKKEAKETGYVTTLLNRRRYVPELASSNVNTRRAGERIAINTPVQGTAADVIKIAMVRLDAALKEKEARLLLQVHDELVVEAPETEADTTAALMKEIMETAIDLDVPLEVEVGMGKNWAEIH